MGLQNVKKRGVTVLEWAKMRIDFSNVQLSLQLLSLSAKKERKKKKRKELT
jgi:hypothetical protein